ncbi:MAG TPA: hypothetical protein VF746_17170 [Longimicrobium sp.]
MTMMMNTPERLRPGDFQVSDEDRPGWVRGSVRTPRVGETVYCAGGEGTVVSVQGKTGNGSCLVQIRLAPPAAPFFAAASNVLLAPC